MKHSTHLRKERDELGTPPTREETDNMEGVAPTENSHYEMPVRIVRHSPGSPLPLWLHSGMEREGGKCVSVREASTLLCSLSHSLSLPSPVLTIFCPSPTTSVISTCVALRCIFMLLDSRRRIGPKLCAFFFPLGHLQCHHRWHV